MTQTPEASHTHETHEAHGAHENHGTGDVSEVYIEGTAADPDVRAADLIRAGHRRLLTTLRPKVALLTELHLGAYAHDAARTALAEFCADDVRRHLSATDQALYAPASGAAETRLLIRALQVTADTLNAHVDALLRASASTDASTTGEASALAQSIEAVLTAHLAVEEEVLLSALVALPGADLPTAAENWTILLDGGTLDRPDVIDATELPHGQRHPRIFARYASLAPGESFILSNTHDPKPLRREFHAAHPDAFTWDYVEAGPDRWQVRIGKVKPQDAQARQPESQDV
ncbi:MAG: DUF2249 domain-containing protein [Actinocrinis sp.]